MARRTAPITASGASSTATTFYDAGSFEIDPATNRFSAIVPLRKATNTIRYGFANVLGGGTITTMAVNVDEFTYSFAEGATGDFFDTEITLANPGGADAPVTVEFLPESGGTVAINDTVAADSLLQILADTFVPNASPSTVVHSSDGVPLAAERTMIWDSTGYGGHGATSVAPGTRWLFAEGAQGYFNTYILLANDNATATDVTVRFLLEGGGVVNVDITVAAKSRHTLFAGDVAGAGRAVVRHRHHVGAADHRGARRCTCRARACSRAATNRRA